MTKESKFGIGGLEFIYSPNDNSALFMTQISLHQEPSGKTEIGGKVEKYCYTGCMFIFQLGAQGISLNLAWRVKETHI